jgi:serine/threonine protein kinase
MNSSREIDARQTADVMREILRKRKAGEQVDSSSFGNEFDPEKLNDLLGALDRVDSARKRRGAELSDGTETLLRAADLQISGFELLRPLGVGGHGVVRQARRISSGELVAIKFLREWKNPDSHERRRFLLEAKIHRELAHPSIVPVIESGRTVDGVDYLVMPFVDGHPLNPNRRFSAMPLEWRLRLFLDICRAVAAAHERGIIHRDLKPSNILIDKTGRPRLVDFGLATNIESEVARNAIQATGKNLGTFLWCSYEQLDGTRDLSPASDVFSLGVILHQMLCEGRFPPDVLRVMEAVLQSSERRPPTRTPLSESIRPDLRRIIETCLASDPARRYPTAGALATAISKALTYQPKPSRRKFWIGAGVTGILLAASVLYWHRTIPQHGFNTPFTNFGKPSLRLTDPDGGVYWLHYAPPGRFTMGATSSVFTPLPDEMPHEVEIKKGFYIANVETTQALYESVMGTNPSRFQGPTLPVERVTYENAMEFCRRLSKREGRVYRLPTEAEWEYACRAGSNAAFEFGDDSNLMLRRGNVADISNTEDLAMTYRSPWNDSYPSTAPVGTFVSNAWRLCDMHGNVWEWCLAPYVANPSDPATAVPDYACARGGSWWDDPLTCRSSNRNPIRVTVKTSTLGFRIVAEVNE